MRILHTESSKGWGGQEIRILREAEGMRERGHEIIFAVAKGGGLVNEARKKGFVVHEVNFKKQAVFFTLPKLLMIMGDHKIDLVNTHSSLDAWIAGIASRLAGNKIIRTRHLSTKIRAGFNSLILYKGLADFVVTTSSSIIPGLCEEAEINPRVCQCIPTGLDPKQFSIDEEAVKKFRTSIGVNKDDVLVGTVCFVRSWKGIKDFLGAASLLKEVKNLKWVIVGGGYLDQYKPLAKELKLDDVLVFTGHLENPLPAISALDIFALLSTAHEGISQASLQAAYLKKPLITTTIGGLPEVCLEGKTGIQVPVFSPQKVAEAVMRLKDQPELRQSMGESAKQLVMNKFTYEQMLNSMEKVYHYLLPKDLKAGSDAISRHSR